MVLGPMRCKRCGEPVYWGAATRGDAVKMRDVRTRNEHFCRGPR